MGDLVSFGVQKLWELLSQEYGQFKGIEEQVIDLKIDLQTLKSFLKDADAKKHTSAMVKTYVEQIKEIIYDAEDIIETFLLKDKLGKTSGLKNRIRRVACIIPERREITLELEGISTRISKVIGNMTSFGVQQNSVYGGSVAQPLHDRKMEMRHTFSGEYENDLVGLEENIKKLVELMVDEGNIQVVSVTGMGGVGKTTLARQVFHHEKVKHHFSRLAWVCVSQEFTRTYVWQTILRNLRLKEEDRKNISKMTEPELQSELYQLLGTSKSLIVLDDIWKEEDWDLIKKILPPEKGSKVLLTSRKKSVAGHSNTRHINFQSEYLSDENSWTLLQKIAFLRKDASELKVDEEMEYMGKKMMKHCGGLPLAIKVLGGLLAVNYTVHDWKRISEDIGSSILVETNSKENSVDHVLSLSFEELPDYLKHCFLYLAHFPEDYTINIEALSYYWAAEEIIPKSRYYHEVGIQDVGDSYIGELVKRNMVIGKKENFWSSRFETCHLHDMMREICMSKAKKENFLQIVGIYSPTANSQSHSTSRRLVLQSYLTTLQVEKDLNNLKLRSFLNIVDSDMEHRWMVSFSSFTRLQLLRVLDLTRSDIKEGELPASIGNLIHLRYLSFKGVKVSHLPSSLGNLKLLIYLNIEIFRNVFVPNILMEMQELKYLALPQDMHKKTKLGLSNLVKLETLRNFSTKNSSPEDLHGMVKLRNLRIMVNDDTSVQSLSASIVELKHLEYLSVKDVGPNRMKEEGQFVLDFIDLRHLELQIRIPRLQQQLPSHLKYIFLAGCQLEEDPMPILEKLHHLEVVRLMYRSFWGKRLVCTGGGFPQLQELELDELFYMEEWIVEEGSMPRLRTLAIHQCEKLKEIPGLLQFTFLKNLSLDKEWEERLKEGGEDYYKVQHIPSVKFEWR